MRRILKPAFFILIMLVVMGVITSSAMAVITAPTNVKASDGLYANFVKVTWSSTMDVGNHAIYRSDTIDGTYSSLGNVPFNQHYFNDTTATTGQTYYYYVKSCYDISCSTPSNKDSGWRGYVNTVTNITATDKSSSDYTFVTWSGVTGSTTYKVYRSLSLAGTKTFVGETSSALYFDTTVSPVSPYYYWVLACNSTHCGEFYDNDLGQRDWPVVQNVNASDGGYPFVRITWDAVSGADGYKVYYSSNGGTTYLGNQSAASNTYDYYLTLVGFEYTFAVTPCFSASCGTTKSTTDSGWFDFPRPTGLTASFDTEWLKNRLSWNEVDPDAWYYVFRDTLFDPTGKTLVGTSGTQEAFSDDFSKGALPGVSYKYWVVACPNSATSPTDPGCSTYSDSSTGRYVPGNVQNVSASDGTSTNHVLVTWDATNASSYQIERSLDPWADTPIWTLVGTAFTNSFQDTSAAEGIKYYYRAKGCGPEICGNPSGHDSGYKQSVCYTLTLNTVGNGALSADPTNSFGCSAGTYIENETISLHATADPEWLVESWSGTNNDSHIGISNAVNMPASAHTVTATFVSKQYTLFVTATGSGKVTSNPAGIDCGSDCQEDYDSGTLVTLTATPDPGYKFTGWNGNCSGTGKCEVLIDTGRGVEAVFTLNTDPIELLSNNSIETELPADWMVSRGIEPADGRDCSVKHSGSCSWQLNGNDTEKRVIYHYRPDGFAGDTFDFSIWRRGENTGGAGYMVALVRIIHKDGSFQEEMINFSGGTVSAWEQRTASFSASENYQLITVSVTYKKPGGTLWFDDISMVKNSGPELMVNRSFELSMPEGWSYARDHQVADGRDCSVWHTGSCAWEINGNGIEKRIVYHYRPDGSAGDSFDFSIWRKGLNTGGAGYMVALIRIIHQDGSFQEEMVNLSGGDLATWEERTATITASENYQLITVSVAYKKPGGTLWVDDISLAKLP